MFDDDYLSNLLGSYTGTTTESETQQQNQQTMFNPQQTSSNPYSSYSNDTDDYSLRPNYEEQQSYNSFGQSYGEQNQEEQMQQSYVVKPMETPLIRKEAPAVNLIKTKAKIELQARMKIVIAMFSIIVATLLFAVVWNFASASQMKASFASKQQQINTLQESIITLNRSYIELSDDEQIKAKAEEAGYVDKSSENTIEVELKENFKPYADAEVSSNWFNDVCDFLSGIFG